MIYLPYIWLSSTVFMQVIIPIPFVPTWDPWWDFLTFTWLIMLIMHPSPYHPWDWHIYLQLVDFDGTVMGCVCCFSSISFRCCSQSKRGKMACHSCWMRITLSFNPPKSGISLEKTPSFWFPSHRIHVMYGILYLHSPLKINQIRVSYHILDLPSNSTKWRFRLGSLLKK